MGSRRARHQPYLSMDDMLGMTFEQMRASMAPAHSFASRPSALGNNGIYQSNRSALGQGRRPMLVFDPYETRAGYEDEFAQIDEDFAGHPAGAAEIPDHALELDVYLVGRGAEAMVRTYNRGGVNRFVSTLDPSQITKAIAGKVDFATLTPVEDFVHRGERVVVTVCRGASLTSAQACSAKSLAQWLQERKPDGAGRQTSSTRNDEPLTRKHFTRKQIEIILAFASAGPDHHRPTRGRF